MLNLSYAYEKNLGTIDFSKALKKVTEALKSEGFGVITEIDVKATFKNKLDVDFRNYRILGACNPSLAHKSLSAEIAIGLLLPCNVIVFEENDGSITIAIANPKEMFKVVDNPSLEFLATEVDDKLQRVLESL